MKKLLILILTLALTSVLLLSACAPEEPITNEYMLYGKPRLSKMSDEELLNVIDDFLDDENAFFRAIEMPI